MPHFKRVEFVAKNKADVVDKFTLSIEVDSGGTFYTHVPDKLRVSFHEDDINRYRVRGRGREGFFVTSAPTFAELSKRIEKAHEEFMRPSVKEEPVILFNIESHVSFALTEDGKIFPNAGYPGAAWPRKEKSYGDHHANEPCAGGYSLTVGAKAMIKKTTTYGDKSAVEYRYYYGERNDHFCQEDPAARLNSWSSMRLPEDPREMPYTKEAAVFFFNLLMSMAALNRKIQEFTNTPEKLMLAISRHSGALLLEGPKK